jgi:hypothetical protein
MNINSLKFWGKPKPESHTPPVGPTAKPLPENVIRLPVVHGQAGVHGVSISPYGPAPVRPRGLFDQPAIREFFALNHYGLGRYGGIHYRGREHLERGEQETLATFLHVIEVTKANKKALFDRLHAELVSVQGVSDDACERLRLAMDQTREDIRLLNEQLVLAEKRSGWVSKPLAEYSAGFAQGAYEAATLLANAEV